MGKVQSLCYGLYVLYFLRLGFPKMICKLHSALQCVPSIMTMLMVILYLGFSDAIIQQLLPRAIQEMIRLGWIKVPNDLLAGAELSHPSNSSDANANVGNTSTLNAVDWQQDLVQMRAYWQNGMEIAGLSFLAQAATP